MQTLTNESAPTPAVTSRKPGRDPVCGMDVDLAQPRGGTALHQGQLYGFCDAKCRAKVEADPERYLQPRTPPPVQQAGEHTCPTHADVRSHTPRHYPTCAMPHQ